MERQNIDEVDFYLFDLKSKFAKIDPTKYYLSYSGGKDSHFLYWFIKEILKEDRIKIVGINTFMEHQDILKRINANCDIILTPTMKPFEIKEKYGLPCFSKHQDKIIDLYQRGVHSDSVLKRVNGFEYVSGKGTWKKSSFSLNNTAKELLLKGKLHKVSPKCCDYLKKQPAHDFEKHSGLKPILGVRSSESYRRSKVYAKCFTKEGRFTPLHDLSDELLEKIYMKYQIEIPSVYDHVNRTGCMGCPYGTYKKETEKELALLSPNQLKFVTAYFKESYEVLGVKIPNKGDQEQ